MLRKLLSAVLSMQLICILAAAQPAFTFAIESSAPSESAEQSASADTADTGATEKDTPSFVPGEVIVMFAPGAVRDAGISLNTARKLDNVDEGFGETMEATGDAKDAAGDAKSEAAILRDILGEDFVLMDSIAFGDDLSIALVRSDVYETADMIDLLSEDDRIASAEANYYKEPQSSDYTYSLDDVMNAYNYQANSPLAHNESGADDLKASGRSVGIGIRLRPVSIATDAPGDISIYLDSIAVSRPEPEIPEGSRITPETSYNIDSGTSMSTPACAGAYAAYAACHPVRDGETGSEYALRGRSGFLSLVTRTDELKDMCSTGGYIDLTHMSEEDQDPVINDAVCDLTNDTLTIYGAHMNEGFTLRYKKLEDKSAAEVTLPAGNMDVRFSEDGKTDVITNARTLFGTYPGKRSKRTIRAILLYTAMISRQANGPGKRT